jgi:hypothetical protein
MAIGAPAELGAAHRPPPLAAAVSEALAKDILCSSSTPIQGRQTVPSRPQDCAFDRQTRYDDTVISENSFYALL